MRIRMSHPTSARRFCRAAFLLLTLSAVAAAEQIEGMPEPVDAQTSALVSDLMNIAVTAQLRGPAMLEQVQAMDNDALLQALSAHARQDHPDASPMAFANAGGLAAMAASDDLQLLKAAYTSGGVAMLIGLDPPAQVARVAEVYPEWGERLRLDTSGSKPMLEVEPLAALFNKRIDASELGHWLVLETGDPIGEITLFNPLADADSCCRIVVWPAFGSAPPTAYKSTRQLLEHEWLSAELGAMHKRSKAMPEPKP